MNSPTSNETQNDCIIYLVRHGQSQANLNRVVAGNFNSPLTDQGKSQAKELALQFKEKNISFTFAMASDLIRAKRTAEIIALEHDLTVATSELLRERSFGRFEGKSYDEVWEKYDKAYEELTQKGIDRFTAKPFEDVESNEEMVSRYITILREITIGHPGEVGLVTSHGGVMRNLLIHIGYATPKTLPPGSISNTAYVKLRSDGIDFFCRRHLWH